MVQAPGEGARHNLFFAASEALGRAPSTVIQESIPFATSASPVVIMAFK